MYFFSSTMKTNILATYILLYGMLSGAYYLCCTQVPCEHRQNHPVIMAQISYICPSWPDEQSGTSSKRDILWQDPSD
jgi:hypothetical protein